jgi:hypothetical protein
MKRNSVDRRDFIKTSGNAAAGMMVSAGLPLRAVQATSSRTTSDSRVKRSLKFSVIGVNHDHIYVQVEAARRGGGELVSFYAKEPELGANFNKHYPEVKLVRSEKKYSRTPP